MTGVIFYMHANTVKPVYNDHLWSHEKVVIIDRRSLYTGTPPLLPGWVIGSNLSTVYVFVMIPVLCL